MRKPAQEQLAHMRYNCVATNLRRATRYVNRIYEEEFRGYEITAAQFAIFALLETSEPGSASWIAGELNADLSTVTRNMNVLETKKLVEKKADTDRRIKRYFLTPRGHTIFQNGINRWEKAQSRILTILGNDSWDALRNSLKKLDETVLAADLL